MFVFLKWRTDYILGSLALKLWVQKCWIFFFTDFNEILTQYHYIYSRYKERSPEKVFTFSAISNIYSNIQISIYFYLMIYFLYGSYLSVPPKESSSMKKFMAMPFIRRPFLFAQATFNKIPSLNMHHHKFENAFRFTSMSINHQILFIA